MTTNEPEKPTGHIPSLTTCTLPEAQRFDFSGTTCATCPGCGTEYKLIGGFYKGENVFWVNRAAYDADPLTHGWANETVRVQQHSPLGHHQVRAADETQPVIPGGQINITPEEQRRINSWYSEMLARERHPHD